jgi:hypothetical protein
MSRKPRSHHTSINLNILIRPTADLEEWLITISQTVERKFPCEFVLGKKYIPHMSLYQTRYPESKRELVEFRTQKIAERQEPFDITLGGVSPLLENLQSKWSTLLFWDALPRPLLTSIHQELLESLVPLRSAELLPVHEELLQDRDLPPELISSLRLYGTLLAGHAERPHFTITRLKNKKDVEPALALVRSLLPRGRTTFTVNRLAIGDAAQNGTVTTIFHEYPFLVK